MNPGESDSLLGLARTRWSRRAALKLAAAAASTLALGALPGCTGETPGKATAPPAAKPATSVPAPTGAVPPTAAVAPTAAPAAPTTAPAAKAAPTAVKLIEELVVASSADPGHLDPRVEAGTPGWAKFQHIYDNLLWRDALTNTVPYLAEKWEQVTPNTLRLYLRKDAKFHNGEPFTADSVKASIEEIIAPKSLSNWKSKLDMVTGFKIADPYTIDIITKKPNRPLRRNLTNIMALSPQALKELGDKFPTNPVGTGPMKFAEYRPGQHLVAEMNPDYWGTKSNYRRIRWRFVPENGTRMAALEAGEVMFVDNVPPDQIPRLKANPNLDVKVSRTNRVIFISLRCERQLLSDKRVRQAMNYAVDKDAITKNLLGGMAPIQRAPLVEGLFGYISTLQPFKYDPEKAKKLLADAGAIGAPFNFGVPNGRYLLDKQVGEAIAGYLEAVGFKMTFEAPTWSTFVSEVTKYEKGKYDGYMYGVGVGSGEPDHTMRDYFYSKSARKPGYSNPQVDQWLDEAAQTFDEPKVKDLYAKAQETVWDECPWIWLYEVPDVTAINKKLKWTGGRRDEYHLFWDTTLEA